MAGFRLGYILCGSKEVAANITDTGQPWSVSSIAQIAGIQALAETDYVARLRQMIRTERERLKLELSALGLEILSGSANYIFFRLGSISDKFTEPEAFAIKMSEQGILVRSCSNYSGLDQSYYRVAVRLPEENDLLIQAVQKLYIPEAFQKEF
jgi:threonine-phosphate decarboxylase